MNWEIFRDQIWNFVGVLIAVAALVFSIIKNLLQKNRKSISYEIVSSNFLLTTKEKIKGQIKIMYNDREVKDVNFMEVRISNSGNIGIPANDYEKPLKITFGDNSTILSSEIVKTQPKNLNVSLQFDKNEIVIEPLLLNSKDSFTIKSVISNYQREEVLVDARIQDVKSITQKTESYFSLILAFVGMVLMITGVVQMAIMDDAVKVDIPWTTQRYISVVLIFIGYILLLFYVLKSLMIKRVIGQIVKTTINIT